MSILPRSREQIGDNLSLVDGDLFFSRLQILRTENTAGIFNWIVSPNTLTIIR